MCPSNPANKLSFGTSARLQRGHDIQRCKQSGAKAHSRHFLVLYVPSRTTESRVAVAVTTKIDKRSVVRNKVRRHIKEFFRIERHRITVPHDLLVIARNGCVECSFEDVRRELTNALINAGLISSPKPGG